MTLRTEIQFTLAMAKQGHAVQMPAETVIALCERWLAVERSPLAEIEGALGVLIAAITWGEGIEAIGQLVGKRVRLLVEE